MYSKAEHMKQFIDYACNIAKKEQFDSKATIGINEDSNRNSDDTKTKDKNFQDPFSGGGMSRAEKKFLASVYEKSNSVFEWGMGSSSVLANYIGVKKLVSVDNVEQWVQNTKNQVNNPSYKFNFVNIGDVVEWGRPKDTAPKPSWLEYSMAVQQEQEPFDVYLVDGRFRMACAFQALLHGRDDSFVMIHDFERDYYQVVLEVTEKIEQVGKLVQLRKTADDEKIRELYEEYKFNFNK